VKDVTLILVKLYCVLSHIMGNNKISTKSYIYLSNTLHPLKRNLLHLRWVVKLVLLNIKLSLEIVLVRKFHNGQHKSSYPHWDLGVMFEANHCKNTFKKLVGGERLKVMSTVLRTYWAKGM
jgi:hypothetical protein